MDSQNPNTILYHSQLMLDMCHLLFLGFYIFHHLCNIHCMFYVCLQKFLSLLCLVAKKGHQLGQLNNSLPSFMVHPYSPTNSMPMVQGSWTKIYGLPNYCMGYASSPGNTSTLVGTTSSLVSSIWQGVWTIGIIPLDPSPLPFPLPSSHWAY